MLVDRSGALRPLSPYFDFAPWPPSPTGPSVPSAEAGWPQDTYEPSAPQPSVSQPSIPQPSAPQPSAPQPSAPQPPAPQPSAPQPPAAPVSLGAPRRRTASRTLTALKGDRRLLTAPNWDRVRVQPLAVDNPIVKEAQRHLGRPYRWGGTDLSKGVDCSGFVYSVYKRRGHAVPLTWFRREVDPRVSPGKIEQHGMKHVKVPRPGDVVIFGTQHVGIYMGNLNGHPMFVGANHGDKLQRGRVDIMPVRSVGIRPVYYRHLP